MKSLKKIVFSVLSEDIFSQTMNGDKCKQKYRKALLTYNQLNDQKRHDINNKILQKIKKKTSISQKLSTLHLAQYLINAGHKFNINVQSIQSLILSHHGYKEDKNLIAQRKFVDFYYQYLHNLLERNSLIDWKKGDIQQVIKQSKLQVQSVIKFLRIDFITIFCLQNSKASELFSIIVINILQRICQDLKNLNYFVNKWSYLIIQKSDYDLDVNQIYEKLIFINKQFKKLEKFRNILKIPIFFPKYTVNKQLNTTIQKEVVIRVNEKKKAQSQKKINQNNNDIDCFAIDEQPPSISITNQQAEFIPCADHFI